MPDSFDDLLQRLEDGTRFSWSRWGDGEWRATLRTKTSRHANCDGHRYFESLGNRLKEILELQPSYQISIQPLAKRLFADHPEFRRLVEKNTWCRGAGLHYASMRGELPRLMRQLKKRHTILVGNASLSPIPCDRHIKIPQQNAWTAYRSIKGQIREAIKEDSVVVYCAGMPANVLIGHFHAQPITQIDAGAIFDPYCGQQIRSYHRDRKFSFDLKTLLV